MILPYFYNQENTNIFSKKKYFSSVHIKRDLRGHVRLFSFFFQKGMLLGGFDVEKLGSDTCS